MRALVAILVIVMGAMAGGVAMAQPPCDIGNRVAHPAMDAKAFFGLPKGSIALGGACDTGNNLCASYVDVTNCQQVLFPLATLGGANRLFVAINTVATCPEECDLVDSFLAAGLLFDHADAPSDWAPFADLRRNYSRRWGAFLGSVLGRQSCCDGVVQPGDFMEAQGQERHPQDFVDRTGKRWHSVFEHAVREEITTWSFRDFFTGALAGCGETCSIKAYLLKFQERAAAEGAQPGNPLLLGANLMDFRAVRLQTMVPFGGDAYWNDMVIQLVR